MIANNIFGLIAKLFIFFKRFLENKKVLKLYLWKI